MVERLSEPRPGPADPVPGPLDGSILRWLPGHLGADLKILPSMLLDPLATLTRYARAYGDLVCLSPGRIYLVNHPDYIQHVLQDHHDNYCKGPRYRVLEPLMGNGLFVSDGAFWKRQRRLSAPAFDRRHIARYAKVIEVELAAMLERWAGPARAGAPVDLRQELIELTLTALLKTMFGGEAPAELGRLAQAMLTMENSIQLLNAANRFRLPAWLSTPKRRRFAAARRWVDGFLARTIERRRRDGRPGDDLISLLLFTRDPETGEGMDDHQLHDELITFLNAGHEATADALIWALVLLGRHPEVAERLHLELATRLNQRQPRFEDLERLPYTQQVVQETLRWMPVAWIIARTAIGPDRLGGHPIPAGAFLLLSAYVVHRDPAWWDQPERFDPDRFTAERIAARPRYAFFPFGGGPRTCVGVNLAMMEVPLILASVCQAYRIELVPGQDIRPVPRVLLKPNRQVFARLQSWS
jgi:cytochrome P450